MNGKISFDENGGNHDYILRMMYILIYTDNSYGERDPD